MARTYYAQILSWDWNKIASNARFDAVAHVNALTDNPPDESRCSEGCDDEGHVGTSYLGKHWDLFPSGRYYAPWSPRTAWENDHDIAYAVALEKAATKYGGWIESGEGDPTDTYFALYVENES